MGYKHFYFAIIVRLMIIIFLSMVGAFLCFEKQAYILCLLPFLLLIVAIINIIRYFNTINQWIAFFLLGIENEDTSLKVPSKSGNKAIDDIYIGIERLNNLFKQAKIDISTQEQYYRSIIDQSATGLFSINKNGRVININPAAVKLTNLLEYHHVNGLKKIDTVLPDFIMNPNQKAHHQSTIFENQYGQKLLFKLSEIKTSKEIIKLVVVSDITKELDNGKVDAWIKLARTLSHEIMNNIAPITTLSQVISNYFIKENKVIELSEISNKTIKNTVKGLDIIEERSRGLMNFVSNYRKFTKLPEPQFKETNLSVLIENNLIASRAYYGFESISLIKNIPENIYFNTDSELLSQVITNILKNALEALIQGQTTNPKIEIKLSETDNSLRIDIKNNGPEISSEIIEQIFVPFYTTKKEGSGVGLSLSKQILLSMDGDILFKTDVNNDIVFSIILN